LQVAGQALETEHLEMPDTVTITREKKRKWTEDQVTRQEEDQAPPKKKPRTWEESFRALVAYKEKNGSCNVPWNFHQDRALGHWVCYQRSCRLSTLMVEQRERLNGLGFDWETLQERQDRQWDEKFQSLKDYKRQHLDCCVPRYYKQDPELGQWVNKQRTWYSQGRMLPDRVAKLESISFTWSKQQVRDTSMDDDKWLEHYNKLTDFSKEHGHCMVPTSYKKDKSLGIWVAKQRSDHARDTLRQDRKELLDKLDFVWRVDKTDADTSLTQRKWNQMLERLIEFKQTNGHHNVPKRFKKWGLGRWVSSQRNKGRNGQLDPQRSQRLLEIGLTWGMERDERWNATFEKLKAYKEKNGHCRVRTVENRSLATWVRDQRKSQEEGTLLPERRTKLDAIGFDLQVKSRGQGLQCDETGEREDDCIAETQHRDTQSVGLDSDEQKGGDNYGIGV
jgi:hypothetical protein